MPGGTNLSSGLALTTGQLQSALMCTARWVDVTAAGVAHPLLEESCPSAADAYAVDVFTAPFRNQQQVLIGRVGACGAEDAPAAGDGVI